MEKLTYKSNIRVKKQHDWVLISLGIISIVYVIGLVIAAIKLEIILN